MKYSEEDFEEICPEKELYMDIWDDKDFLWVIRIDPIMI